MEDLRETKESTVFETNTGFIGVDVVENTLVSDLTF